MSKSKAIEHVAIIMDGNGRWAKERAHRRIWGHIRGAQVVTDVVESAQNIGVKALTLYAFSTENFSRPQEEVSTLFSLLKKFLKKEKKRVLENNLRFKLIGDYSAVPKETQKLIEELENLSRSNTGMWLNFAFGYGGRAEILHAVNHLHKIDPQREITEELLSASLYNADAGDVDLMIRTGGDQRISNFLLWQAAYAELFFTPIKWPDFSGEELKKIIVSVSDRERRFGTVVADADYQKAKKIAHTNRNQFIHTKD